MGGRALSWLPAGITCSMLYFWGLFLGELLFLSVLLAPLPLLATGMPTLSTKCLALLEAPFSRTTGPGLKAVILITIFFKYASPGSMIRLKSYFFMIPTFVWLSLFLSPLVVATFFTASMAASSAMLPHLTVLTPPRSILEATVVLRMKGASSARASTGGG